MNSFNEKLKGYFSDQDYVDELILRKEQKELPERIDELLEKVASDTSPSVLLKRLFEDSEKESFVVNFILSECFFLISELINISPDERDYALDMSTYLSEDSDSRDPSFDPGKYFAG